MSDNRSLVVERVYLVHRCKSCKVQAAWEQRDRFSWGGFHGEPEKGCAFGQYLAPEHVETIAVRAAE